MTSVFVDDRQECCVLTKGCISCKVNANDYLNECYGCPSEEAYKELLNAKTFLENLKNGVKFSNQCHFELELSGVELAEGAVLTGEPDEDTSDKFETIGVITMSFRPHEIVFRQSETHEDTSYIQIVTYNKEDHMIFLTFLRFMIKIMKTRMEKYKTIAQN
jgi:hypothetical protein